MRVSIIVPVYNCEKYIKRCLDSLINQTYKNIEVVIINDGSTDNSQFIIEQFAYYDDRIRLYCIENHGVSYARNLGLKNATGEYIMFCDADDYYDLKAVEKLIKCINEYDVYVVFSNYSFVYKNNCTVIGISNNEILNKNEALNVIMRRNSKFNVSIWAKIFKKSILDNIYFDEHIYYGEDSLWLLQVLEKVSSVLLINDNLYYYYFNGDSAVNKPISKKRITELISYEKSIDFLKRKGYSTDKYDSTYIDMIFKNLPAMYKFDEEKLKIYLPLLREKIQKAKYSKFREIKWIIKSIIVIVFPNKRNNVFRIISIIKHPFLYIQGKL